MYAYAHQIKTYCLVLLKNMTQRVTLYKKKALSFSYKGSLADTAHLYSPEFYPHYTQHYLQHQQDFQGQGLQTAQRLFPSLYGTTSNQSPVQGYLSPTAPTPSPVAQLPASTVTDFILPEIVENRRIKERINFIPLSHQYLAPINERPFNENPTLKPPSLGDDSSVANGYYYPQPQAPPNPSTTTTEYPNPIIVMDSSEALPFNLSNQGYDYNAPSLDFEKPVRPSPPVPGYLPPSVELSQGNGGVVKSSGGSTLRLHIHEMRCQQKTGGFFKTILRVNSFISAPPSVDNDSNDKRCEIKLQRSFVVIDIVENSFQECGVHPCGTDLCLKLRFPMIHGMRTDADAILTLHCKTQDRIAMKTHALKMGVSNLQQARRIGTYARGGSQNPFRTHIELLRKANNGFTKLLESNGAVQLGEELLLRAHVLTGDGWNYTKLSDVSLQRASPSGEILNSVQLISSHGCMNPSLKSICEHAPIFDPPLGHKLVFKAVMFQGMHSGDELVMSMRITGCLEYQDCQVSAQDCSVENLKRRRRNVAVMEEATNNTEASEISRISFKVLFKPEDEIKGNNDVGFQDSQERWVILCSSVVFVAALCAFGLFAALKLR